MNASYIAGEITLENETKAVSYSIIKCDGSNWRVQAFIQTSTMDDDEWERVYSSHFESPELALDKYFSLIKDEAWLED